LRVRLGAYQNEAPFRTSKPSNIFLKRLLSKLIERELKFFEMPFKLSAKAYHILRLKVNAISFTYRQMLLIEKLIKF
jgi:hypothetical protein